MKITRTSMLSGKTTSMELDVTMEQLHAYHGEEALLQDAFPNLNADEREFIKTGITSEEWDSAFGEGALNWA
jgi:hypothetical protein